MEKKTLKDLNIPGKRMLKWISILMLLLFMLRILLMKSIPEWIPWIGVGAFDIMCLYIILYLLFKGKAKEFGILILNLVVAMIIINSVGLIFYNH